MIEKLLISSINFLLGSPIFKFFMPNTHAVLIQLVYCNSHPYIPPKFIRPNPIEKNVGPFRLKKSFLLYSRQEN